MSNRMTAAMAMVGIGVGLALGLFLAGPADAQYTTFPMSPPAPTAYGNENFYITGMDGGIWYTSHDPGGLNQHVKTGNDANPFDHPLAVEAGCPSGCTGFVQTSGANSLIAVCAATGNICVDKWVRVPGPGTFMSGPLVFNSPCPNSHNIFALGQNSAFWYTLFDGQGLATATQMDGGCASGNPFISAGEDMPTGSTGTGFVKLSGPNSLQAACIGPNICFGPWKQFP